MDWIKADLVFIPEIIDYTNDSSFTHSLIKPETIELQLRRWLSSWQILYQIIRGRQRRRLVKCSLYLLIAIVRSERKSLTMADVNTLCHRPIKCNIELPCESFDKLPRENYFDLWCTSKFYCIEVREIMQINFRFIQMRTDFWGFERREIEISRSPMNATVFSVSPEKLVLKMSITLESFLFNAGHLSLTKMSCFISANISLDLWKRW